MGPRHKAEGDGGAENENGRPLLAARFKFRL